MSRPFMRSSATTHSAGPLGAVVVACLLALVACKEQPAGPKEADRQSLFLESADATGLRFRHFIGSSGEFFMPEIMGAGVGLIDFDNDGDLDVFLPQGRMLEESKPASSAAFPLADGESLGHRLFRNELVPSGQLRFTNVTKTAGVGHIGYGMGVAIGDFDDDGFPDLYVTQLGSNILFRNRGNGTFEDITARAGVDDSRWSTSAAFVDYDRDGHLDLFVLNYLDFTVRGNKQCQAPTGEPDYCTPKAYQPVSATLFRNLGNGRFQDVTQEAGVDRARGPGLGVSITDINDDGWPDLYVANDGMANILWLNQRNGTYRETALESGAAYAEDGIARAGMGVSAGDFDRDGDDDLFVVNLAMEGATLYRNDGNQGFLDITRRVGLSAITYSYTGFGTSWFDFDNDGWLDLFIANGAVTRIESLRGQPYPFPQRNLLLRNEEGKRFVNASDAGGAVFDQAEVSRGAAFGDIDGDGDVDIVVSNNNGPVRLLLNQTVEQGGPRAIAVYARTGTSRRIALGARVSMDVPGRGTLASTVRGDSSYLSASHPVVYFPARMLDRPNPALLRVRWPDGTREEFQANSSGLRIDLVQGRGIAGR